MVGKQILSVTCERAAALGSTIDITGCRYGIHSATKEDIGEAEYYRFLAGLSRLIQAKQILEIGTHYGGSIMAMARGAGPDAKLVTVDLTNKNAEAFAAYPNVIRVKGDSTDPVVSQKVSAMFSPPIDLLFIDSLHTKEAVLANLKMYKGLQPRYAVFDDIHISDTMNDLWSMLQDQYEETFDLSDIVDRKKAGFGVIKL